MWRRGGWFQGGGRARERAGLGKGQERAEGRGEEGTDGSKGIRGNPGYKQLGGRMKVRG